MERLTLPNRIPSSLDFPNGALVIDGELQIKRNGYQAIRERVFPKGQIEWTQHGDYYWTVPDDVFEISAIVIGAGGRNGSTPSSIDTGGGGGGGGGAAYGTFSVFPGEQLQILVSGSSHYAGNHTWSEIRRQNTQFTVRASRGSDGGDGGRTGSASGGSGGSAFKHSAVTGGAFYGSSGGRGDYDRRPIIGDPGYAPEIQGLGRGRTRPGQNTDSFGRAQGKGAVRLIWGRNRAYPSTTVQDV